MVHVYGAPETDQALLADERLCVTEDPLGEVDGVEVIYHAGALPISGGGYACPACGAATQ